MTRLLLPLAVIVLVLGGCVGDNRPESCDAPSITLELELSADALNPGDPSVCRDQTVTLEISSEVDGVIHIHGYDAIVPATPVSADETLTLEFTAERSGQFPVELHPEDDPEGVSVGVFTVHEP